MRLLEVLCIIFPLSIEASLCRHSALVVAVCGPIISHLCFSK